MTRPRRKGGSGRLLVATLIALAVAVVAIFVVKVIAAQRRPELLTVLRRDGRFTIFTRMYDLSHLPKTYVPGPFTMFVPLDSGFRKLPDQALETLLTNPYAADAVLLRHIAPGYISGQQLRRSNIVENFRKLFLRLEPSPTGQIVINGATVVQTDLVAKNGVIHVLDRVLESER